MDVEVHVIHKMKICTACRCDSIEKKVLQWHYTLLNIKPTHGG